MSTAIWQMACSKADSDVARTRVSLQALSSFWARAMRAISRSARRRSVTSTASTWRAATPLKLMLPAVTSASNRLPSLRNCWHSAGTCRLSEAVACTMDRTFSRSEAGNRSNSVNCNASASV